MSSPGNAINANTTGVVGFSGTAFTASTLTQYQVNIGGASSHLISQVSGVGDSGQVLTSNGAGSAPTWQGIPAGTSDFELISSATASASATIDFTGLNSTYFAYKVFIEGLAPATDAVIFWMRTSTNGGVSYDSGASDYAWNLRDNGGAGLSDISFDVADSEIQLGSVRDLGNAANETSSFEITIYNPSSTNYTYMTYEGSFTRDDGTQWSITGNGVRLSAADVDAIRFLMSSGNIASGNFRLYGIRAS